jgi:hypothetical protein
LQSPSRIRNRGVTPSPSNHIEALRACGMTQALSGCRVEVLQ